MSATAAGVHLHRQMQAMSSIHGDPISNPQFPIRIDDDKLAVPQQNVDGDGLEFDKLFRMVMFMVMFMFMVMVMVMVVVVF